ncbi:MAG TPA: TAXI family TRAP transporter solute-binding subunit [Burkholderiales bacterium]|nr:TAXI family TRAP transporter solute-binding subunit [Burkholderiales bacterium]
MQALYRSTRARIQRISWRDLAFTAAPVVLVTCLGIAAAYWIVRPAPPRTITITAGPPGSVFRLTAEKYQPLLARNGIDLKILASQGSLENLKRLADPKFKVDVGFVLAGISEGSAPPEGLVSLGSVFHQPVAVFYRSKVVLDRLSAFTRKRVAIGHEGSGSRVLALTLLKANGITPETATLLDLGGDDAAQALLDGKVDAVFLMGDSATPPTMRKLLQSPGVRLFSFAQADAYVRRYRYLEKLQLPMGVFDLGANTPVHDAYLVGPTVDLVARPDLHPALSDLLIEAAQQVHGKATLLQRAGEFPAPLEHEFPVSDDARRYYKSGKSFLYRTLPFWVASLTDRILVLLVPIVLLLLPGLRLLPSLYSWRIRSRIYRQYGQLLALERGAVSDLAHADRRMLVTRLDEIEAAVNRIKVPVAYADQLYVLREHINFVRNRLCNTGAAAAVEKAPAPPS